MRTIPVWRGPLLASRCHIVRYGKKTRDDLTGFLTYEAFTAYQGQYKINVRNPASYFRYWIDPSKS